MSSSTSGFCMFNGNLNPTNKRLKKYGYFYSQNNAKGLIHGKGKAKNT
jgi:hypothetical protein